MKTFLVILHYLAIRYKRDACFEPKDSSKISTRHWNGVLGRIYVNLNGLAVQYFKICSPKEQFAKNSRLIYVIAIYILLSAKGVNFPPISGMHRFLVFTLLLLHISNGE